MGERLNGSCVWFNSDLGYGFVESNKEQYFVHYSNINMKGYKKLEQGQSVSFVLVETDKGVQASDVKAEG